ncbi:molybdenum cofactor biosynthesis protein MoaE [Neisseria leonii]|uniref:Molybdopterin synthase catalytic subunit n=1 Tax=Neisseria leonii TaxID=2995413 RepID=A0A9X4E3H5_9NEIS|nr:molybdenum cofactor biosynthesis protein MoaE [Neisseria sp. 51.81]MDD9327256.1 molybdenum cofactor biosynthesis protein MoaE [Neisseria sp. 51.81]
MFDIAEKPIDAAALRQSLTQAESCGAFACFEGWVRNHNDGKNVDYLVYTTYPELAKTQGLAVIEQAKQQFKIDNAVCVHRVGRLAIGDMAVWVGVTAGHRDAAFAACRFIIDTVKAQVPIWKQEFYRDNANQAAWLANPESH